jgi:flavin reductase (DIM6/NTAB) family NADH-FMN oxidoreductase RutF
MKFDPQHLSAEDAYKLLTGVVVPRPIAWVSTLSPLHTVNAAPFSSFTFVANDPPMLAINIGRRGAEIKDTARNILARREFVVNIADFPLLDALHGSAVEHPAHVSETELLGIATEPSEKILTPRIALAPVSMECVLHNVLELGASRSHLVIGEVLLFHVRDSICEDGKIDTLKLNPICRLGGPTYARLGELVRMPGIHVTQHL